MTGPDVMAVMRALTAGGSIVRFVGGCVRDAVVGRPVRDIDIATPDKPDRVVRLIEDAGIRAIPTGIEHGTVTAVVGKSHFEITSLRHDVETYGRRARVAFTDDWVADAARRDFTINALFADPDGTIYDPTGGLADLKIGRVRFVGEPERRIDEDALRILRFFRFHAHYGRGEIDAAGMAACRSRAEKVAILPGERVCGELLRLLEAPDPAVAIDLMREAGVLRLLLPEAGPSRRLSALVRIETERGECVPLRRLAALLDTDGDGVERVAGRLRLSNRQRARLVGMVVPAAGITENMSKKACRRAIYLDGAETFRDLVYLAWADRIASDRGVVGGDGGGAAVFAAMLALAETWKAPKFPLRGRDALGLGLAPGAEVGRLLKRVEQWWIDGDFRADRDAAMAHLKLLVDESGETG